MGGTIDILAICCLWFRSFSFFIWWLQNSLFTRCIFLISRSRHLNPSIFYLFVRTDQASIETIVTQRTKHLESTTGERRLSISDTSWSISRRQPFYVIFWLPNNCCNVRYLIFLVLNHSRAFGSYKLMCYLIKYWNTFCLKINRIQSRFRGVSYPWIQGTTILM